MIKKLFLPIISLLICVSVICSFYVKATAFKNNFGVSYIDVAKSAGITAKTIYGDERTNKYLLETTGCGIGWIDYNDDGLLDLFIVNGTRLSGFPKGQEPFSHLYQNIGNGKFTDVTKQAGVGKSGWGQSVNVGDYDNDGFDDMFVTYFGKNVLYKNNGNGSFTDVSIKAGVAGTKNRWGSGAAFVDYDKDGDIDLFVANYIDMDLKTAPTPDSGPCLYKGVKVACGPPGLDGGENILYKNNGNGTFSDVSDKLGKSFGTYGLGVVVSDFDNDTWPDIYVANDSAPATLYLNNKNGSFTDIAAEAGAAYSSDGKPQAGMGVSVGDFNRDGLFDIFKTNFSGDTSTLYRNAGIKSDLLSFDDITFTSGIGINTRWLGWGCGFLDFDNDGKLDIYLVNGHVYPEVAKLDTEAGYAQRSVLYLNNGDGMFKDITEQIGPPLTTPLSSRGAAFADFDNDGDIDIAINPVNDFPALLQCESTTNNNWIAIKAVGTKSNKSAIGARVKIITEAGTQIDEIRSGGSYYSQNDLRIHFGLGKLTKIKLLEILWPSGIITKIENPNINRYHLITESM